MEEFHHIPSIPFDVATFERECRERYKFSMFYAERLGKEGESYIAEQGIFTSLQEYMPYRKLGWSAQQEIDRMTDRLIEILGANGNKFNERSINTRNCTH